MERERESEGGLESWAVEEKEEESEGGLAVTLSLPSRLPQQEREAEAASVLRPSVLWRRRPRYVGGKNDDMPACVARPPTRPPAAAWLAEAADDVTTDGWARRRNFSSLLL